MSGILGVIAAASGGVNSAFAVELTDVASSPGALDVYISFTSDGTTAALGALSPPNWHLPTTTGVGAGWSVRLTTLSSAFTSFSGAAMGSWQVLSTTKTFIFTNSTSTSEAIGTAAVAFSPDGGTTVIAAGEVAWDVGYAP